MRLMAPLVAPSLGSRSDRGWKARLGARDSFPQLSSAVRSHRVNGHRFFTWSAPIVVGIGEVPAGRALLGPAQAPTLKRLWGHLIRDAPKERSPAVSYSPTPSQVQYHQRWQA